MAKYNVIYSCGHEATVELFGKEVDRQRKIEWFKNNAVCPCCYKAQCEAAERKSVEGANANGLVELTGSEKQIAWANKIRANFVNSAMSKVKPEQHDMFISIVNAKDEARWWIENRDYDIYSVMRKLREV